MTERRLERPRSSATDGRFPRGRNFLVRPRGADLDEEFGEERCQYAKDQAEDACNGKDDRATGADRLK
ncbi:MAG: hypothetical protein IIA41_13510 [SAR324 cluster bacterium]|nr:hypothetical protein [SAR324 cluster bacterium]